MVLDRPTSSRVLRKVGLTGSGHVIRELHEFSGQSWSSWTDVVTSVPEGRCTSEPRPAVPFGPEDPRQEQMEVLPPCAEEGMVRRLTGGVYTSGYLGPAELVHDREGFLFAAAYAAFPERAAQAASDPAPPNLVPNFMMRKEVARVSQAHGARFRTGSDSRRRAVAEALGLPIDELQAYRVDYSACSPDSPCADQRITKDAVVHETTKVPLWARQIHPDGFVLELRVIALRFG